MQISCPKCAARYELDDRLIPPTGAPVQCSHCTHVFIATPMEMAPPDPVQLLEPPGPPKSTPPAAPRAGTQIFGAVAPKSAPKAASPPHAAPRAPTQMFGAGPTRTEPQPAPHPPTQMFGAAPTKTADPQPPPREPSQMFGAGPTKTDPQPPPRPPTQMFGVAPTKTDPQPAPRPPTQMFGVAPSKPTSPEQPKAPARGIPEPMGAQANGPSQTSVTAVLDGDSRAGSAPAPAPGQATEIFGKPGMPGSRDLADPVSVSAQPSRASRVELPPLELSILEKADTQPEVALQKQLQQRNRIAIIAVCAVVVALVGFRIFQSIYKKAPVVPVEASTAHANALGLLRRDDTASKEKAVKVLDDLTRTYPAFIQARATQLLALALQLDDIKFEIKHLEASTEDLNRKIADLQQKQAPSDWQNRVNALLDRVNTLRRTATPLVAEATALDKRTNDAFTALKFKPEELQPGDEQYIARAQAIYFGVKGSEKTIESAEKYRSLGGKDGWDAIALGEYTVNVNVPANALGSAKISLERLRARDPAFLRAYVIGARQALALNQTDAASSLLEAVVTLNPSHELARKALTWIQEAQHPEP